MLITLCIFIMNVALPQLGAYAQALIEPMMMIIIGLAGIVMLFGAVGMKISTNLGSTVVGGVFMGIGYVVRMLFQAISWIVQTSIRMTPRVFNGSRSFCYQLGLNEVLSNVFATMAAIAFIAIII